MDVPFSRWHLAITERRSRRHFDQNRPIEPETLVALNTLCNQFRPFPHARSRLVTESGKGIFKGIVGSYGKIKSAPTFIAFIRDMNSPFVQEEVGYTSEGIILEATALGLNTCWVAGFFRLKSVASLVEIGSKERILAVSPVGYARKFESLEEKLMTGFGRKHRRLSISKLVKGVEIERWPEWVRDKEVEAVIVYTLDRLSRDPAHFIILQEGLEKAGVELILVTETIDSSDLGRLITYIKGYTVKLEAQKIRERIT